MKYRLEAPIRRVDMLAFGGVCLTYVGFILTNFNVLFLPRLMGWIILVGFVTISAGIGGGVALYRILGTQWSLLAAIAVTWTWFVLTFIILIHDAIFDLHTGGGEDTSKFTPMQHTALQTSGQRWLNKLSLSDEQGRRLAKILIEEADTNRIALQPDSLIGEQVFIRVRYCVLCCVNVVFMRVCMCMCVNVYCCII